MISLTQIKLTPYMFPYLLLMVNLRFRPIGHRFPGVVPDGISCCFDLLHKYIPVLSAFMIA